jgi:general secretion pathway protein A
MYAEYFGFSKLPFSATPDPQVFFDNSLYREAFATLQYGVMAKKGFVVITGEVGTGKTTLLRKLLHSLGPAVHSVFIFNTQVSFVELLRLILDDLNLARESDDKLTMIETLNHYLIERLRQGHIVTLLIDEAQNLSDEALEGLRLLSNLETDTEKLLQIVLMGQPELEIRLDQPKLRQLKQRITLQCRLAPLKKEEVGAYIEFRLNAAGCRGRSPFHRASLETIALYSKGIPRRINIICDNALLAAFARAKKEISPEMVVEVAADLRLQALKPGQSFVGTAHSKPARRPGPASWLLEADKVFEDDVWVSRIGSENFAMDSVLPHQTFRNRHGVGTIAKTLVGLVTLGGVGVTTLYPRQMTEYFSRSVRDIQNFAELRVNPAAGLATNPVESQNGLPSSQPAGESTWKNVPVPARAPVPNDPTEVQGQAQIREENLDKPSPALRTTRKVPSQIEARRDSDFEKRRVEEAEINKAIQNRAISGVTVSVINGTVYLDGRVASVRQKLMAERAARTVAKAKNVRNRLAVRSY